MTIFTGTSASETIAGTDGNDYIFGDSGPDSLLGGAGDDYVEGRGGSTIEGGDGNDTLRGNDNSFASGGAGIDTFQALGYSAFSHYVVTDFQAGAGGDRIDLSTPLNTAATFGNYTGGNPFTGLRPYLSLVQSGADTLVKFSDHYWMMEPVTILTLRNVDADDLTAANFVSGLDPKGDLLPTGGTTIVGSEASEWLTGTPFADSLVGGDGWDTLDGAKGNDTLIGGAGFDSLMGGTGENLVDGGDGDDWLSGDGTVIGGAGNDRIDGISGTALGGDGDDRISAGKADSIDGGAGNDYIQAYGNVGAIAGGTGRDVFDIASMASVVITDFKAGDGGDQLDLSGWFRLLGLLDGDKVASHYIRFVQSGANTLVQYDEDGNGGAYAMRTVITLKNVQAASIVAANHASIVDFSTWPGASYPEKLTGGYGDDTLAGSYQGDTLIGYMGDDTYYANATTIVIESPDEGRDTVKLGSTDYTAPSYVLAANVENLELDRYAGKAKGNELDNAITIVAGAGNVDGGAGNDTITGGTENDTIAGGAGNDVFVASAGKDSFDGGAGNDTVQGLERFDLYQVAFDGQNRLVLTMPAGQSMTLANVETVIFADGMRSVAGIRGVSGTAGNDRLAGTDGNDTLDGGAGNDTLAGGKGDDVYVIDSARDVITEAARAGTDTARVSAASYTLGANVENLVRAGSAAFNGTGNALDNAFTGSWNDDTFDGAAGNDRFNGQGGDDRFLGGDGNDTVDASAGGAIFFDGGAGIDRVEGLLAREAYEVARWDAQDTVLESIATGEIVRVRNVEEFVLGGVTWTLQKLQEGLPGPGADEIAGTDGDDILDGLGGPDTMTGGAGDDIYLVASEGTVIVEEAGGGYDLARIAFAGKQPYRIGDNVEEAYAAGGTLAIGIAGNAGDNLLRGNDARNTLEGGAGNDTLDGGKGSDMLAGGSGDDTYYVDVAGDKVTELADEGTDTVVTDLAKYALGANVENLVLTSGAAFTGTGNALDNEITGGSGSGTVDGGAGTDTFVVAGMFEDYTRQRPNGTDLVLVNASRKITLKNVEQVRFADGLKTLAQLYENVASLGNDTLTGTGGDDEMNGLAGADQMSGGLGNDTYFVDNAGDAVIERANEGIDTVNISITAKTTYTLGANVEHATITSTAAVSLIGNAEGNKLTGNGAANALTGGEGNDTLVGGKGSDTLDGGAGDDVYSVDVAGDKVVEGKDGGYDIVETTATKYTLAANVEELRFTGKAAFTGIGNALDNVIAGGAGNDKLTGGAGQDTFVIGTGNDTITDFASGIDRLLVDRPVGDGDGVLERVATLAAPGGFATDAELVIFTQKVASFTTSAAAKAIGSAAGSYYLGETALFALHNANTTALFLFTSKDYDAVVSAGELAQVATLTGVATWDADDIVLQGQR